MSTSAELVPIEWPASWRPELLSLLRDTPFNALAFKDPLPAGVAEAAAAAAATASATATATATAVAEPQTSAEGIAAMDEETNAKYELVKGGKLYIKDLQQMDAHQLHDIAKSEGIQDYVGLKKQDLIFQILRARIRHAPRAVTIGPARGIPMVVKERRAA